MRTRRTFTKEYKTEIVKRVLSKSATLKQLSKDLNISEPLMQRWVNDYVAQNRQPKEGFTTERRKDFTSSQELKAKIADLYMHIEKLQRNGITYHLNQSSEKEV